MNDQIEIFDRRRIRQNRTQAARNADGHTFLIEKTAGTLLDRLCDIRRSFQNVVLTGMRAGPGFPGQVKAKAGAENLFTLDCAPPADILAEEDVLPLKPGSLDLIVSNFNLHNVNDLPGALVQMRQALKPDGLLLAALPGGETLCELREVFTETELALKDGLSPRIHPFAGKQDMGALLQRAGYTLIVVDSDLIKVSYDNFFKLLADLRGMGEGNAVIARNKTIPGKRFFMEAARRYAEKYANKEEKITASFEIIYLIGWAPHESQQKPLRPGSAKTRLADVLDTEEKSV